MSAVNFTAQPVTISGTITPAAIGAGATVTLTGPASATATADAAGAFTFSALPNGSYAVTPAKSGVAFTPASRTVVIPARASVRPSAERATRLQVTHLFQQADAGQVATAQSRRPGPQTSLSLLTRRLAKPRPRPTPPATSRSPGCRTAPTR